MINTINVKNKRLVPSYNIVTIQQKVKNWTLMWTYATNVHSPKENTKVYANSKTQLLPYLMCAVYVCVPIAVQFVVVPVCKIRSRRSTVAASRNPACSASRPSSPAAHGARGTCSSCTGSSWRCIVAPRSGSIWTVSRARPYPYS